MWHYLTPIHTVISVPAATGELKENPPLMADLSLDFCAARGIGRLRDSLLEVAEATEVAGGGSFTGVQTLELGRSDA